MWQLDTVDVQFQGIPHAIASYIIRQGNAVVMIETGPGSTVAGLAAGLAGLGLRPSDVTHVLVTHVHLDHAGAAGWMAQQGAPVYVHHVGAPHLMDPSRLWASATRIYGAQMTPLWGQVWPIPAIQVHALHDGDVIDLGGGLQIVALDTPGHAWHHMAYQVEDICFSGDVAAARMPGYRHVRLPTPPPEIDVPVWHQSVERLRRLSLRRLYLTHFGPVDDVPDHLAGVDTNLDAAAAYVLASQQAGQERDAIVMNFSAWLAAQVALGDSPSPEGESLYELVIPSFMSVDGLLRFWRKANAEQGKLNTER